MIRGAFLGCRSDPKLSLPLSCVRPQLPTAPSSPGPRCPCCLCSSHVSGHAPLCTLSYSLLRLPTPALLSSDLSCIIIWSFPDRKGSLPTLCSHVSVSIPGALISVAVSSLLSCQLHDRRDCLAHSLLPSSTPVFRVQERVSGCSRGGRLPSVMEPLQLSPSFPLQWTLYHVRHLFLKHISDHLIAWRRHFQGVPSSYSIQFTPLIKPSPTQDLAEFPNSFLPISFTLAI